MDRIKKIHAWLILLGVVLLIIFIAAGCKNMPQAGKENSKNLIETDADSIADTDSIANTANTAKSTTGMLTTEHIVQKCVLMCEEAKKEGREISSGPCLSDGKLFAQDWVCDVAHSPRADVDNEPKNQCREFREGNAHHFVEVDENCKFIKKY